MSYGRFLKRYSELPAFTQSVLFRTCSQLVILICGSIVNIILARWLGPHGKGEVYLAILVPTTMFTFASFAITNSVAYFAGQKKYSCEQLASSSLFIAVILSVFTGGIYFVCLPLLKKYFLEGLPMVLSISIFMIFPASLIVAYLSGILYGIEQVKKVASLDMIKSCANLILVVLLVIFLGMGVIGALFSAILSFLLTAVIAIVFLKKVITLRIRLNREICSNLFSFGLKSHLGTVVQFFNYRLDMFLVKIFLSSASVGIYSISVLIAELIWFIPGGISEVLFARVINYDAHFADKFTPQICRCTVVITTVVSIILGSLAYPIIWLFFGREFLPSLLPLWLLLPGVVALSLGKVISSDLVARGRPLLPTYTAMFSLIITIILYVTMIPRFGISGAALASTFSYTLSAIAISIIYSRVSGNAFYSFVIPHKEDIKVFEGLLKKFFKPDTGI